MVARKRTALGIYELYIELEDIAPRRRRRLLVPAKLTLPKLHDLLQLAMGWTNSHLHSFQIGENAYSTADADLDELEMLDEKKITLEGALGDSARGFVYEYDFGDSLAPYRSTRR
ncbi:MAG: plasmid pRiA4b family protein [Gammaproteobacteria bacterium]|nr:plasmid pRiA4b family protein [Gammaproteobacteria bacterium]